MSPSMLLALTSHGNAPYLMAARLASALGRIQVIIPDYYQETQQRIMLEELPDSAGFVWFSRELGEILYPLLLDVSNGSSFGKFGKRLAEPENPQGVLAIENRLYQALQNGLLIESMDGKAKRKVYQKDLCGVLNSTLPIRAGVANHIFFFTGMMSHLYGTLPPGDTSPESLRTLEDLHAYSQIWRNVEDTYSMSFIPRINAFSYTSESTKGVIPTPPLAFRRQKVQNLDEPSLLFIPSGTRTDVRALNRLANQPLVGYKRLIMGYLRESSDFSEKEFSRVNATVFGDPLLKGVVSRGGWGTIWECICNGIPMAVPRLDFSDDPEIGHTQLALHHKGIGIILDDDIEPFLDSSIREKMTEEIERIQTEDKRIFGFLSEDGFSFMALKILEMYPEWMEYSQTKEAING